MNSLELKDFLAIASLVASGYAIFLSTQRDSYTKHLDKPVLNFIWVSNGWVLMNIGKSCAVNVRVIEKIGESWQQPFIAYSIPANFVLDTSKHFRGPSKSLLASYEDRFGKKYVVECSDDTCSIYEEDNKWDEFKYRTTIYDLKTVKLDFIKIEGK